MSLISLNLKSSSVIVTGARNQIGYFLCKRLVALGIPVYAISRQTQTKTTAITWLTCDLERQTLSPTTAKTLYHIAPLKLAIPLLKSQRQIKRVIAFSSTSRFTKTDSSQSSERQTAQTLAEGEQTLIDYCDQANIAWTILRPTLVYGCALDKNITLVAGFIQRFGFFPIVAPAKGLRQPVHADDLAAACLQVLDNPCCYRQSYQLSGGETLSYRQMIQRVFAGLDRRAWLLPLPLFLFKFAYHLLAYVPLLRRFRQQLNPAMLERMNQDLCFEHRAATIDFGYQARAFYPDRLSLGLEQSNGCEIAPDTR